MILNQSSYEAQPTAEQQLWASQLGLGRFDLEVLQLHGHAHVPRDLQLPLEERLRGRDIGDVGQRPNDHIEFRQTVLLVLRKVINV